MIDTHIRSRLVQLRLLVIAQRVSRVLVRVLWLSGGGWIMAWAIHERSGLLPNPWQWWFAAFGFGLFGLGSFGWVTINFKTFVWKLERRLKTQEVLSAALELDQTEEANPITKGLIEEVGERIDYVHRRVAKHGWYFGGDLDSLAIIFALVFVIQLSSVGLIPQITDSPLLNLPGLGKETSAETIFPQGIPGVNTSDLEAAGVQSDPFSADSADGDLTSEELGDVGEVLEQLGEQLAEQAATAELGEALQQGDLDRAAQELGDLAGQTDALSDETREQFSEALETAAENLQQPNQDRLQDAMQDAADGVASGENDNQALDNLAQALQAIGQQAAQQPNPGEGVNTSADEGAEQEGLADGAGAAGSGVGAAQTAESESFDRFEGEGAVLDLSGISDQGGLLQPGTPQSLSGGLSVAGIFNFLSQLDPAEVDAILAPYRIIWNNRDVVSKYFTPAK
jgi:NTP pyrophosphatase (non-canonical NTP hydrolase)